MRGHELPPVEAGRPRRTHSLIVSQSCGATPVDQNLRAHVLQDGHVEVEREEP